MMFLSSVDEGTGMWEMANANYVTDLYAICMSTNTAIWYRNYRTRSAVNESFSPIDGAQRQGHLSNFIHMPKAKWVFYVGRTRLEFEGCNHDDRKLVIYNVR